MSVYIVKKPNHGVWFGFFCKGTKKGQADYIAPLQPNTLASVKTWGIQRELTV